MNQIQWDQAAKVVSHSPHGPSWSDVLKARVGQAAAPDPAVGLDRIVDLESLPQRSPDRRRGVRGSPQRPTSGPRTGRGHVPCVRGQRIAIAAGAATVEATVTDIGRRSCRRTCGTTTAAASAAKPATRKADLSLFVRGLGGGRPVSSPTDRLSDLSGPSRWPAVARPAHPIRMAALCCPARKIPDAALGDRSAVLGDGCVRLAGAWPSR